MCCTLKTGLVTELVSRATVLVALSDVFGGKVYHRERGHCQQRDQNRS